MSISRTQARTKPQKDVASRTFKKLNIVAEKLFAEAGETLVSVTITLVTLARSGARGIEEVFTIYRPLNERAAKIAAELTQLVVPTWEALLLTNLQPKNMLKEIKTQILKSAA